MNQELCPVYAGYCDLHGFTHGAEAEELRKGIEQLAEELEEEPRNRSHWDGDDAVEAIQGIARKLKDLLEEVDARDSTAFLESEPPKSSLKPKRRKPRITDVKLMKLISDLVNEVLVETGYKPECVIVGGDLRSAAHDLRVCSGTVVVLDASAGRTVRAVVNRILLCNPRKPPRVFKRQVK